LKCSHYSWICDVLRWEGGRHAPVNTSNNTSLHSSNCKAKTVWMGTSHTWECGQADPQSTIQELSVGHCSDVTGQAIQGAPGPIHCTALQHITLHSVIPTKFKHVVITPVLKKVVVIHTHNHFTALWILSGTTWVSCLHVRLIHALNYYLLTYLLEETFNHSHPLWSSVILYSLPLFTTIHGILPVMTVSWKTTVQSPTYHSCLKRSRR